MTMGDIRYQVPSGPCGTCPYAVSTPPGIWADSEYDLLPRYDQPTWNQPVAPFLCHYDDGDLCGGWLATHDTEELLAVRLMAEGGRITMDQHAEIIGFTTSVACHASGQEACDAGKKDFSELDEEALDRIERIERYRRAVNNHRPVRGKKTAAGDSDG